MKMDSLKPSHYINIVKTITAKISIKKGSSTNSNDGPEVVKRIIEKYKNHPSISIIRNIIYIAEKSNIQFATIGEIWRKL